MRRRETFYQSFMKLYKSRQAAVSQRSAEINENAQAAKLLIKRSFKKWVLLIAVGLFGFGAVAGVMECALRGFGYQMRELGWDKLRQTESTISIHPERIWETSKNLKNIHTPLSSSNASKRKVLFLGDPIIKQASDQGQEDFIRMIGQMFNDSHLNLVAYSINIDGYGPEQEYSYVVERVLPQIHPDMIVWSLDYDDYWRLQTMPMYLLTKGSLFHLPAFSHGLYLQGVLCSTVMKVFPASRLLNLAARLLEKNSLDHFLTPREDYEIIRLMNCLVDNLVQRGIPVVVVRAPRLSEISKSPAEYKKWPFFNNLGPMLPNYIDANQEILHAMENSPDRGSSVNGLFQYETFLSEKGKLYYAKVLFNYVARYRLLTKP